MSATTNCVWCVPLTEWGSRSLRNIFMVLADQRGTLTTVMLQWLQANVMPCLLQGGTGDDTQKDLLCALVKLLLQQMDKDQGGGTKRRAASSSCPSRKGKKKVCSGKVAAV